MPVTFCDLMVFFLNKCHISLKAQFLSQSRQLPQVFKWNKDGKYLPLELSGLEFLNDDSYLILEEALRWNFINIKIRIRLD